MPVRGEPLGRGNPQREGPTARNHALEYDQVKIPFLIAGVIAVAVPAALLTAHANRPRVRIAEPRGYRGLRVITRDQLLPVIDTKIGGHRLQYPKPDPGIAVNMAKYPYVAGFIDARQAKELSVGGSTYSLEGVAYPDVRLDIPLLNDSKLEAVPYVFGTKRKLVQIKPQNQKPFKIWLPPNGIPAPKLKVVTAKAGPYVVHMKPRPIVSPALPIVMDVTVEGGRAGQMFALCPGLWKEGNSQSELDRQHGQDYDMADESLFCGSKPARLRLRTGRARGERGPLFASCTFDLSLLKEAKFQATVKSSVENEQETLTVLDEVGKLVSIWKLADHYRIIVGDESGSRHMFVTYRGSKFGAGRYLTTDEDIESMRHDFYIPEEQFWNLYDLKRPIKKLTMTAWEEGKSFEGTVVIPLPDARLFVPPD